MLPSEPTTGMPADAHPPRRRDRRRGFAELLAILARCVDHRGDVSCMRGAFEDALARIVPVRTVRLREAAHRWPASSGAVQDGEVVALDVPGGDPDAPPAALEAAFPPGTRIGEWDFQTLGMAAHVGALVLEIERIRTQLQRLGASALPSAKRDTAGPLVGSTPAMQQLRDTIARVAGTDFTVLLEGESGVGKELVARQIHEMSRRRGGPFVAVNCAAIVETLLEAELFGIEERTATGVRGRRGKFEAAAGGTLFLDEVSDLSQSAQAKLLRTLQDLSVERVGGQGAQRVDVRIVAATNRALSGLVDQQLFRRDLYYRLSGVDIRVPSLRERQDDVLELTRHFLDRHRATRSLELSAAAAEALSSYPWPGNVRELERLVERVVALSRSDVIALEDLPAAVRGDHAAILALSLDRGETLRDWSRRYTRLVVDRCQGNKRQACRVLGITYHTLQSYLKTDASDDWGSDTGSGDEGGGRVREAAAHA